MNYQFFTSIQVDTHVSCASLVSQPDMTVLSTRAHRSYSSDCCLTIQHDGPTLYQDGHPIRTMLFDTVGNKDIYTDDRPVG